MIHLALAGLAPAAFSDEDVRGFIGEARELGQAREAEIGAVTGDAASEATLGTFHAMYQDDAKIAAAMRASGLELAPSLTGDANEFGRDQLNATRAAPYLTPHRKNATLASVPVDRGLAPADAQTYEWWYEDFEGQGVEITKGDVTGNTLAEISRSESPKRPIYTYAVAVKENWLQAMFEKRAGVSGSARRAAAAGALIDRAINDTIAKGRAGVDAWSLASGLPCGRRASSVNLKTGSDDAVIVDQVGFLDAIGEENDNAFQAPNAVQYTQRAYNRITSRWSRASGVDSSLGKTFREELEARGLRVVINNDLKNADGVGRDIAVAYHDASISAGEPDLAGTSLLHAYSMEAAPVHRWTGPAGDMVLFAARTGHLCAPHGGSVLVQSNPVL